MMGTIVKLTRWSAPFHEPADNVVSQPPVEGVDGERARTARDLGSVIGLIRVVWMAHPIGLAWLGDTPPLPIQ